MSSRVQKGSTIFRPVAQARSRAPTVPPSQSSSGTQEIAVIIEDNSAPPLGPPPSTLLPIPSTAIPGREPRRQSSPAHQIVPALQRLEHDPSHEQSVLARGANFLAPPNPPHTPHAPPVLVNTSNLPPTLSSAGRPITEPVVTVNVQQDSRPPIIFPHPFHFQAGLAIMTPGPNQQNTTTLSPPISDPTELQNTLVPSSSFESFQQPPTASYASQHEDEIQRSKRKRKTPRNSNDGEVEEGASGRKVRSRSNTPRQRQSRGPSLPPFDPEAGPGEDIDPTIVTMATLCSDTGQGRVSSKAAEILSNHAAWKTRNRERRARMKTFMEAKKYGREVDDETHGTDRPLNLLAATQNANDTNVSRPDEETGIDYSQQLETSRFNVQVRIGPNGETVIDEESLVVDRAENEDTLNYTHVVESDHTKFVNSGTYGKRYRGSRWSTEETELFYNALSQYGENYELIAYVLPGRDRKSCKNKFKAEDKKNHARINYCLNNRIPVDMKTLERMTGKDFSGPVPEIRAVPPTSSLQPEPVQEPDATERNTASAASNKQTKRRSRSRTAGVPEEGVVIVGDIDSAS